MRIQLTACMQSMAASALAVGLRGSVWLDQGKYEQAEGRYQHALVNCPAEVPEGKMLGVSSGLSDSIEATMSIIQQSLSAGTQTGRRTDLEQRVTALEKENQQLKKDLQGVMGRVAALETRLGTAVDKKDEDNIDLFGSDEEEEETEPAQKVVRQVKGKKPPVIAKSTIVLDVKPWDTETDMKEVERLVRGIATDGLLWGASKLVAVAYGIMKLQISCVVEDEKVGTDFLEESITAFEDHVQSVDVVAFNKL